MPTYDVISNTVVGAVNSVTISGINSTTYKNLRLVFSGRESTGGGTGFSSSVHVIINSDTGAKYSVLNIATDSSTSIGGGRNTNQFTLFYIPGSGTTAGAQGFGVADFIAIDKTNTMIVANQFNSNMSSASSQRVQCYYGKSLGAVSSIQISTGSGNQFQNSRITLYGLA